MFPVRAQCSVTFLMLSLIAETASNYCTRYSVSIASPLKCITSVNRMSQVAVLDDMARVDFVVLQTDFTPMIFSLNAYLF